ncbi:hypothetical protein NIES2135_53340 [Leptolyngbya boryana NIES-2135]|jgi:hypothetical protein|uniref:Uncharacterized protein n=1 Tax=Leptolyngbya boryana NIES-2135 TaxID=1973484 RepID=A0A1Z4JNX8_LEPBY|nr:MULTISPECIES: hypothetical protein [Leptolyngbya]BAY58461.1 hypothetical protein NIES2135_53340 [Leptolyngbya boryana NIES-2135]MBD2370934.1 hypothetical protein [Leptolyngbya sp. FACHB-161]MBD2377448.1 hypothetical protein [Leptolyngbya sp. FACHB-238]MBD2401856.1 hypothetical protein [Leptolyngbya sp. FACHB-239]MBD2408374.1 hypothetical protein [Leptolyngbya sp. FACHB-402]
MEAITEEQLFEDVKALVGNYLKQTPVQKEIPLRIAQATDTSGLDLHMGEPTPQQLEKINQYTGETWEASEWFVCAWHASDNLVDRSRERWHLNILQQMTRGQAGRVLMTDHNQREVKSAVGFAFETALILEDNPDPEIVNSLYADYNAEIVDEMGLVRLIVWTAISSDSPVIEGLRKRSLDNCSTGGIIRNWREICPNCSREKGYEVGFWDTDKEDRYVCPHLPPYPFLLMWLGDDEDANFADYIINDGQYDAIELSIVNAGCLPAARVMRGF